MQHNEAHYAVESLLRAHSAAIEQVRVLCRSPGRHCIHQQSCELALASTYKQALQKLTNMLTAPLLSHQLSAQHLQHLLQPALDMVLAAILQGKRFLESCRSPLPLDAAIHPYSRRIGSSSASLASTSAKSYSSSSIDGAGDALREDAQIADVDKYSWLQRALLKGLATDAMDVHLHDFLVAFSAVGAAVQDLNAQYAAQISKSRIAADPAPSPDLFWKLEQNKPHVLLVSAQQLDQVKQNDETVLNSQLEQTILNLKGSPPDDGDAAAKQLYTATALMPVDDAAQLAAFVKEKMRCAKQALQESLDPGFLDINKLEVVNTISDSFSTSVHRVMWLGKEFALKVYKKSMEEAFQQEAQIHVRLNHPNVVHAVALFKGEQKGYGILIELMDETLHTFLQRHAFSLSLQEKVRIMLHIAMGMAYVHERGVIHRDLKPLNVLVRSSMNTNALGTHQIEVKVADFGESRSRMPNSSSFKTKKVGTTVYRAPEVLNDDNQSSNFTLSYKKSADVYSFAMTCFELLAETEPFHDADKWKALWERVLVGERPDLESISDAACPPYLKHCLTTWWAEDPKSRHSFTHICCVLRHLYACLARCRSDTEPIFQQFPFLAWPLWRWKKAQDIAQERLDQFEKRREDDDWKDKGYLCESTRVNEIPYEMHVMNWAIKKAAKEPDEAIDAAYNAQSVDVILTGSHSNNANSIHQHLPSKQSEIRRFEPTRPQVMNRSDLGSSVVASTQAPMVAPQARQGTSSTSSKSFGEKLKEFCCFPAVTLTNHEAFHTNLHR